MPPVNSKPLLYCGGAQTKVFLEGRDDDTDVIEDIMESKGRALVFIFDNCKFTFAQK